MNAEELFAEWTFSARPHWDMSREWRNEFWPPKVWGYLSWDAIDEIEASWQFDDSITAKELVAKITREQFLLWSVCNVVGQIFNGGFSQVLINSQGEVAEEAVIGLHQFGMHQFAKIIDDAWNIFGVRPIPRDRDLRARQLELLSNFKGDRTKNSTLDYGVSIFKGTEVIWSELENKFFRLVNSKNEEEGNDAAYYKPLEEWIYKNRDRIFIV